MPVEAQTVEYVYIGDGTSVAFAFPSKFLATTDIIVGLDGQEQVSGFTVTGAGVEAGGTVTFAVAPLAGVRVSLLRKPPASQLLDFVNGQTVLEGVLDTGLDKLTMLIQYLLRGLSKSIRLSDFDNTSLTPIGNAASRAGKLLAFDSSGQVTLAGAQGDVTILLASQGEAVAATDNTKFMSPLRTAQQIDGRIATQTEAETGTNNTKMMTPLRVLQEIRKAQQGRAPLYALDFAGIVNDGSADCSAGITALLTTANGSPIYFPAGTYRLDSPITYNGVVNIRGAGAGVGPGLFTSEGATIFLCNFADPSGFVITTLYSCIFEDFRLSVNTGFRNPGSGRAISITGAVGNNAKSVIRGVAFDNFFTQIYFQRPSWNVVTECYFQNWKSDAILSETDGTREGSTGFITHNWFFGNLGDFTGLDQRSVITTRCGYCIISENEILGGQYGINVDIINFDAGFVKIINNTIENQYYFGIRCTASGANDASMFDISGNEFSNTSLSANYLSSIYFDDTPARVWVKSITITRNIMRHLGSVGLGYIRIASGQNINISDNVLEQVSGTAALGIGVVGVNNNAAMAGSPAPLVTNNIMTGTFSSRYSLSSTVPAMLVDPYPVTFATVPANCAPGSQIYVSDGKAANWAGGNYTLAGSGTVGYPAFRSSAGIWTCFGPS